MLFIIRSTFFPYIFQGGIANVEYFATGTQQALQYFNLNPTTGEISAKQSLASDVSFGNDEYTVSIKGISLYKNKILV